MAIKNSKITSVININIQKIMILGDEISPKTLQMLSLTDVCSVFSRIGARAKRISSKKMCEMTIMPKIVFSAQVWRG